MRTTRLTANAQSGFAFTNWTDGSGNLLTNRATLQFTMVTNLALTANFAGCDQADFEPCDTDREFAREQHVCSR